MADDSHRAGFLPISRSEALTDGIFAVAMTLLVIELKLPPHDAVHSADDLANALMHLLPKAISWLLSFFVLALFWIGHHRVFANVRRADGRLIVYNLIELAAVSLMPFSSALSGEFGSSLLSQAVYSTNMALLGIAALLVLDHVYRHPELTHAGMPRVHYLAACIRIGGLIAISAVAVAIAAVVPVAAIGNVAFMLMAVISPWSRRLERKAGAESPTPPIVAAR